MCSIFYFSFFIFPGAFASGLRAGFAPLREIAVYDFSFFIFDFSWRLCAHRRWPGAFA
jgi:hypothetical protein